MFDAWIESHLGEHLLAFLPTQRWFGGKTREIRHVRVHDALVVARADEPLAMVLIDVTFGDDGSDRYAVPIAARVEAGHLPVIGPISKSLTAVEASADATAMAALLMAFGSTAELRTVRGGRVVRHDAADDTAAALATLAQHGSVAPLRAEQSNTSSRVGRDYVFKLIRKLDEGENLELEIGRYLTRLAFTKAPALRGAWTWIDADGRASTVGLLQDWVENDGDGWQYVLQQLEDTAGVGSAPLLDAVRALGATTASLHVTLSADSTDPAFRPEPLTQANVQEWEAALATSIARVCGLLTPPPAADDTTGRLARRLVQHAARLRQWRTPSSADGERFDLIRIHGDYHLGQTLRTFNGFVIIDFEGEPAKPLHERRRRHAAMKDVAGMLRSFDYAIETAGLDTPRHAAGDPLPHLRAAFLDAYYDNAVGARATFLPQSRAAFDQWVSFFELDKAVYEIEYELNHRPSWAAIPMRGALRLLGAALQ